MLDLPGAPGFALALAHSDGGNTDSDARRGDDEGDAY